MLASAKILRMLWTKAMATTVHINNQAPMRANQG